MIRDERGFTLIEMLIVLMIFGIVTIVVLSCSYQSIKVNQYEQAIERLRLTIHVAQLSAQHWATSAHVYAHEGNEIILVTFPDDNKMNWQTPEGMYVNFRTNSNRIRFKETGNISEIGKVEILTPEKTIEYSINMSKGRLRLIE